MPQNHYAYYVNLLRRLPYAVLRRITRKRCHGYSIMRPYLKGKYGLEIGGPSRIFCGSHFAPVYDICRSIDNCNFSSQTIWTKSVDGQKYGPSLGKQFVAEASDLSMVPNGAYDFVLASHVLEHIANPLRAMQEWKRVLIPGGTLLVVLPDKRGTFDHGRAFTSFDHIEADFQANAPENDLTHLNEVLELHDLDLDPPAGSRRQFQERCLQNYSIRGMHHHVFSPEMLVLMFSRVQMRVLNIAVERPFHIIGFALKVDSTENEQVRLQNLGFLSEGASWRKRDPLRGLRDVQLSN